MEVTILTGHLSRNAGGFAVSIPGMRKALERTGGVRGRIVGLEDPLRPEDWKGWGERVVAVRQSGPRALGFGHGMLRAIDEGKPDVVDAQGIWMYPSIVSLLWSRRTGKPYVVTPRGMLDPWALSVARTKKAIAYRAFERRHLQGAACLRATSALEADNFRAFGLTNPIAVIPNGVDVPDLAPRPDTPMRRVLFLSRIHPKKGIDHLLAAWARIESTFADWELVIAGPDEHGHRGEMKNLAKKLSLQRVCWLDSVSGDDKDRLYRSADLFVLPTRAENFGLVVAEALLQEVPVITTKFAPWQDLETNGCGWWIDLDEDALVGAMEEAMRLPRAALQECGKKGRAWVADAYGWPKIGHNLRALYSWITGAGVQPSFVRMFEGASAAHLGIREHLAAGHRT